MKGGGLPFRVAADIPAVLDRIVENYERYQSNITVSSIESIATAYAEVFDYCYRKHLKSVV